MLNVLSLNEILLEPAHMEYDGDHGPNEQQPQDGERARIEQIPN